jgi:type IV pilus assembly protein PilX
MTRLPLNLWEKRGLGLSKQRGAALVVGLLLLLVLTVLGISGLVMATMELQMAGNQQYQERAFQAAEFGIEQAMRSPAINTTYTAASPLVGTATVVAGPSSGQTDSANTELYFDAEAGITPVPGGGYSLGTGLQAYHFVIESEGTSARGATDAHTQSFYILGPAAP